MQELTPESVLGQKEQILLYGEPKTGKTEMAFTAPAPIYYMCIGPENEMKTRYSQHFLTREDGIHAHKKVYFDTVLETYGVRGQITDNPTGFDEVCTKLDKALLSFEKGDVETPQTIVFDNATVLEQYQMNKAMIAGYELAGSKEKTALKRLRDYGIIKPGDTDWGAAQSLMSQFIAAYSLRSKFHIIFIAHEYKEFAKKGTSDNSREREMVGVYPLFVGQQRIHLTHAFDNVWRTTISGGGKTANYFCQTVGDEIVVAGTRVGGVIPAQSVDLNLTKVIEKFKSYPIDLMNKGISKQNVRASINQVSKG